MSKLLGHSSTKVTEKHYVGPNDPAAIEAVESLTYADDLDAESAEELEG